MDKINPFRNSENDSLVDAVRAVLSGRPYEHKEEMDPVNKKAVKKKFKDRKDKDIDNDGDVDDSEKFLHKRRKAISKAIAKEGLEDNKDNPANRQHLCAKNVVHEEWGEGQCIPTMHADPDEEGMIAWYDVMFEHGIEAKVSIDELKVTKSEEHMHASVDKKKKLKKEMAHGDKKKVKKEAAHDDEDDDDDEDKKKKKKKDDIDMKPSMDDQKNVAEKSKK